MIRIDVRIFCFLVLLSTPISAVFRYDPPLILAHRGLSGVYPEESLSAYRHAAIAGADYLECDIQVTKDSVPVCSHEPNLSFLTTDIESGAYNHLFDPKDRRNEVIDRTKDTVTKRSGWFIADYNWDQVKKVRLVQRYAERTHVHDGKESLITLNQLVNLAMAFGKGIYIESKDSTWYHAKKNVNLPRIIVESLCKREFCEVVESSRDKFQVKSTGKEFPCPIFLQTFVHDDLVYWDSIGVTKFIPTVALTWDGSKGASPFGDMWHRTGDGSTIDLDVVAADLEDLTKLHVEALGVEKVTLLNHPDAVNQMHAAGMGVHVWTIQNEFQAAQLQNAEGTFKTDDLAQLMDSQFQGDVYREIKHFVDLGVDGLFVDYATTMKHFFQLTEKEKSSSASSSFAIASLYGVVVLLFQRF